MESARQSLCHGCERRSMGAACPTFACSVSRWTAAHDRYSCCDQRDFLSTAHRLPMASSSTGLSSLGHRLSLFPDLEELRCVDLPATGHLRANSQGGWPVCVSFGGDHGRAIGEDDRTR